MKSISSIFSPVHVVKESRGQGANTHNSPFFSRNTLISFFFSLLSILFVGCAKDNIIYINVADDISDTTIETTDTIVIIFSNSDNATVNGASMEQSVSISGNGVTIVNNSSKAINYHLSGTTSNGFLKIYSGKKQIIELDNVSITNTSGAAINVQGPTDSPSSGKATYFVLSGSNSLADGSSYTNTPSDEDEKAALFCEGKIIFSGNGSMTVTANGKSGIACDNYMTINGGNVTVNSTASTFVTNGDTTKVAGIKPKDGFTMANGTLIVNCSGSGAKGISSDGTATFSGGTVTITVTGSNFGSSSGGGHFPGGQSSDNSVAAKGIKFDGDITFNGGTLTVNCSSNEGIESKGKFVVNGGHIYSYSSDDAINCSGDITINDGYICAHSTGNDGIDANGDCYLNGGVVYAIGASRPEVAIDANTEEHHKLYVQGGTIIAIGGLESGAALTQSCYQASSWSKSTWYALSVGDITYAFKTPSNGGSGLVVSGASTPTLKSGVTASGGTAYFNGTMLIEATVTGGSDVTLTSYTGGNGGPGGH